MTPAVVLTVVAILALAAIALGDNGWALWVAAAVILCLWVLGLLPMEAP